MMYVMNNINLDVLGRIQSIIYNVNKVFLFTYLVHIKL